MQNTQKKEISASFWTAQHPNIGQNIQQKPPQTEHIKLKLCHIQSISWTI